MDRIKRNNKDNLVRIAAEQQVSKPDSIVRMEGILSVYYSESDKISFLICWLNNFG